MVLEGEEDYGIDIEIQRAERERNCQWGGCAMEGFVMFGLRYRGDGLVKTKIDRGGE